MIYTVYGQIGRVFRVVEKVQFRELTSLPRKKIPGHTLYHFWISYFSRKTRRAIYEMGIDIPFKDVLLDQDVYADLVQLGGKDRVPCLRIETDSGVRWMYESRDIIAYLKTKV
jgi:hypothetical protein